MKYKVTLHTFTSKRDVNGNIYYAAIAYNNENGNAVSFPFTNYTNFEKEIEVNTNGKITYRDILTIKSEVTKRELKKGFYHFEESDMDWKEFCK